MYKMLLLSLFSFLPSSLWAQPATSWSKQKTDKLQAILLKGLNAKKSPGNQFAIAYAGEVWQGAAGDLAPNQPFFIASTTKLFTTALVLQLRNEGKLQITDSLPQYFSAAELQGLHVYKGRDYSHQITIAQLLAHTSGLPDYFQGKDQKGYSLEKDLVAGNDQAWDLEGIRAINARQKAHFAPGTKGKAVYSDTNFQLLGEIIQRITGQSFGEACQQRITTPLQLTSTWLFTDTSDQRMAPLRYKREALHIPKAMASTAPDGGMVSTSTDLLLFLQAFFGGQLFPAAYLLEMQDWNRIFYPMQSGMGMHLFALPAWMTLGKPFPALQGHSGLSGTVAYYSPEHQLFIAGTVNQIAYPDQSFRLALKLIAEVLKP